MKYKETRQQSYPAGIILAEGCIAEQFTLKRMKKESFSKKLEEQKATSHHNFRKDPPLTKDSAEEGQTEAQKSSEVSKQRTDTTRTF